MSWRSFTKLEIGSLGNQKGTILRQWGNTTTTNLRKNSSIMVTIKSLLCTNLLSSDRTKVLTTVTRPPPLATEEDSNQVAMGTWEVEATQTKMSNNTGISMTKTS